MCNKQIGDCLQFILQYDFKNSKPYEIRKNNTNCDACIIDYIHSVNDQLTNKFHSEFYPTIVHSSYVHYMLEKYNARMFFISLRDKTNRYRDFFYLKADNYPILKEKFYLENEIDFYSIAFNKIENIMQYNKAWKNAKYDKIPISSNVLSKHDIIDCEIGEFYVDNVKNLKHFNPNKDECEEIYSAYYYIKRFNWIEKSKLLLEVK